MPFSNPSRRVCARRSAIPAALIILTCGISTHAAERSRSSRLGGLLGPEPACYNSQRGLLTSRNNARILGYSPAVAISGVSPVRLTIDGENFTSGLRLAWKPGLITADAVMLPTTLVDSSRLTATIPANLLTTPGKAYFAVVTAESFTCARFERFRIHPAIVDVPRPHATGNSAYTISTVAGNGIEGFAGDGGPATSAKLNVPSATAVDSLGNLYIADYGNSRVRKVSNGIITTIVGTGVPGYSGDGGQATNGQLSQPAYLAFDSSGNLYIADQANGTVRKVSNGIITTVAGTGIPGFSGDGGPATSAQLSSPEGIALDSMGNLYIADAFNQRIRKISGGIISTIAGNGVGGYSGDSGPATSAMLQTPTGVTVDPLGNVYIADFDNERVRKVSGGIITTVAGNGSVVFSGDGGLATNAGVNPFDVALDSVGDLYIVDDFFTQRVRKVSGGIINTIAGNGIEGFAGDGGPATSAELDSPEAVALDSNGDVFVTDTLNFRIRKLTPGNVPPPAAFSIAKTHTGNFTQGQLGATYNLTVSNSTTGGSGAGTVTVTDTIPAGMVLVSMGGVGWTCAPNGNTCTRNDALPPGQSYPAITATVNISASATSPQVNMAMVAGGGSASAIAMDSTIVMPSGPMVTVTPIALNPGDTAVMPVGVTAPSSNAVFVTLTSSDPSVVSLSTASLAATVNVLIPAGATASPGVRVVAGRPGSVTITATAFGYLPASMMLTVGTPSANLGLVAIGGTPQSAVVNKAFAAPLAVSVIGANPGAGLVVTFTAPATGPSGSFAGGATTAMVATNAAGVATSPLFTANSIPGSYLVLASAAGVSNPVAFSLTNQGGAAIILPMLQLHAGDVVTLPVSLSSPPTDSVFVSITSSNAAVLSLSTATQATTANVLIPAGQTTSNLRVVAGLAGTVTLTATATGYPPTTVQLVVLP